MQNNDDPKLSVNASEEKKQQTFQKVKQYWGKLTGIQKELVMFVVAPTAAAFLYFALWASPMYVSETQFAIRAASDQPTSLDFASQLFKTANSTAQDAQVINAFIRSPDAFDRLDKKLKIVEHYSDRRYDIFSRLSKEPTLYERQIFWDRVGTPVLDPDTGIIKFTVRAYTPEMAQKISQEVLAQSEALVNEMNERARQDSMALAEKEVKRAQERLSQAQVALKQFRDTHKDLDPKATATGLQTLVIDLEGQRATLKAQIAELQGYMRPTAPMLKSLEGKLKAIEAQLNSEKQRLAGQGKESSLNSWVSEFESLTLESEFAQKQLVSAMTAMETARVSLLSQARYVVSIEQPTLPDESLYPKILIFTTCIMLGLALLFGLVRLVIASIREHAGF